MYGEELASVYDQVYLERGKDYRDEAELVLALIAARAPGARTLLDVACGTGLHLEHFAGRLEAAGLELSPQMLAAARARLPGVPLHLGDMRDFALDIRFDAITCMFSSIGHMRDPGELDRAIAAMARHLNPGGVLVIEPWWFPETYLPGYVNADVSTREGRTVARVSHSSRLGTAAIIEVHYTVADARGIDHFVDHHEITLFDRDTYEQSFRRAGLSVDYLADGPSDRGVFVGVRL